MPLSILGSTVITRLSSLAGSRPKGARLCFGIASESRGVRISLVSHPMGLSMKGRLVSCLGRQPRLRFQVGWMCLRHDVKNCGLPTAGFWLLAFGVVTLTVASDGCGRVLTRKGPIIISF